METIGDRIRKIRGNISQEEFAQRTEINKTTLGRYERGVNSPDSKAIKAICDAYHVRPEWLFTGKGKVFSDDLARFPDTSLQIGLDEEKIGTDSYDDVLISAIEINNEEYNDQILVPIREAFLETIKSNWISLSKKKFDLISLLLYEEFITLVIKYTSGVSSDAEQQKRLAKAQKRIIDDLKSPK